MNLYFYWFYTIYDIYCNISRDKYFYMFTLGMFSLLLLCSVVWLVGGVSIMFDLPQYLFSNKVILPAIFVGSYLFNYFLFVRKDKHLHQYSVYQNAHKKKKSIIIVAYSILSVIVCFLVVLAIGQQKPMQ